MNIGRVVLTVGLALTLAACALAQDEAVTLRYKYVPGETTQYELLGGGAIPMTIDLTAAGQGLLAMNTNLDMTLNLDMACQSLNDDGSANIEMRIPEMVVRSSIQQGEQTAETVLKWENGSLSLTVNGQPQPQDANTGKLMEVFGTGYKMKSYPDGRMVPDPETVALMSKMQGANGLPGMDMNRMSALTSKLPVDPVKVGDTWTYEDETKVGEGTLKGSSTFTLAAIEDFEGRRCARIEGEAAMNSTGALTLANQPQEAATQGQPQTTRLEMTIDFVSYLDLEAGHTLSTRMDITQNMDLLIFTGARNEQGQPVALPAKVENGQMTMEQRKK